MKQPRFGAFEIRTNGGPTERLGVVGKHWAVAFPKSARAAAVVETAVTDLASGLKTRPIEISPIDAVSLVIELDALGPASPTDGRANEQLNLALSIFLRRLRVGGA